jgi:hypothetical protein
MENRSGLREVNEQTIGEVAMAAAKQKIVRKPGYLYYIGSDGYVWASPMTSNPQGKKHRASDFRINRKKGEFWYVEKNGTLGMTKR